MPVFSHFPVFTSRGDTQLHYPTEDAIFLSLKVLATETQVDVVYLIHRKENGSHGPSFPQVPLTSVALREQAKGSPCDLGPPYSSFRSHHSLHPSTPSTHPALCHFRISAHALPYVWHLLRPNTRKVGPSPLPGLSLTPSPQRGLSHPNSL